MGGTDGTVQSFASDCESGLQDTLNQHTWTCLPSETRESFGAPLRPLKKSCGGMDQVVFVQVFVAFGTKAAVFQGSDRLPKSPEGRYHVEIHPRNSVVRIR